jgi:hypothetical protein
LQNQNFCFFNPYLDGKAIDIGRRRLKTAGMSKAVATKESSPEETDGLKVGLPAFPVGETVNRVCFRCKKSKILSAFYKKGDRYDSQCKQCILKRKTRKRKMLKLSRIASRINRTALVEAMQSNFFENNVYHQTSELSNLSGLLRDLVWETILEP